ncbi:hypothetical protein EV189_3614 [Motilibacter rhizosphaerae]|uniref:Uncharacterized protein n=1 Tax=Motilibacter rhizosphaerae TaxID=598652 RepID=A0A4Q7NB98_9ACTN|nr:hypothetical protein [Motilibacter rhizosphaerae]RZS80133.1 hypothetical protein EV189_3614 [Motilibacter rhizosphaerae]
MPLPELTPGGALCGAAAGSVLLGVAASPFLGVFGPALGMGAFLVSALVGVPVALLIERVVPRRHALPVLAAYALAGTLLGLLLFRLWSGSWSWSWSSAAVVCAPLAVTCRLTGPYVAAVVARRTGGLGQGV